MTPAKNMPRIWTPASIRLASAVFATIAAGAIMLSALPAVTARTRMLLTVVIIFVSSLTALAATALVLFRAQRLERRTWGWLVLGTAGFSVAAGYKVFTTVATSRYPQSPSLEDAGFLVAIVGLTAFVVMFSRPSEMTWQTTAVTCLDGAMLTVATFVLSMIFVIIPSGVFANPSADSRIIAFCIYATVPLTIAIFPIVFRRGRWPAWARLSQLGIVCGAGNAIGSQIIIGLHAYRAGDVATSLVDASLSGAMLFVTLAAVWRLTAAGNDPQSLPEVAESPRWPGVLSLALCALLIPYTMYYSHEASGGLSMLFALSADMLAVLLVTRASIMLLQMKIIAEQDDLMARYEALVENAPSGITVLDRDGAVVYANTPAARMLDFESPDQMVGMTAEELLAGSEDVGRSATAAELIKEYEKDHAHPPAQLPARRIGVLSRIGREVTIELTVAPVMYARRPSLLIQATDVTATVEAESAAAAYRDQLKQLAADLVNAKEHERKVLAERLHDHLGQLLAVARIRLKMAEKLGLAGGDDIDAAEGLIKDAIARTRAMTAELAPQSLYRLGLGPALTELACDISTSRHVRCDVEEDAGGLDAAAHIRALVYRSVRELVMNAVEHSCARSIRIFLGQDDDCLRAVVTDDGCGFEVETVRQSETFGLMTISESIDAMGGRFSIQSTLGHGTVAEVRLPFREPLP